MRRLSGPLLMATGVLDLLYVLVFHFRQLAAIAQDGFFDAVELHPAQLDRETAFWHLTFGTTVLILGALVHWAQARTGSLPASLGWSLLALGAPWRSGSSQSRRAGSSVSTSRSSRSAVCASGSWSSSRSKPHGEMRRDGSVDEPAAHPKSSREPLGAQEVEQGR